MVGSVIEQGDILRVEMIKQPVLTVSKNYFNRTGAIIGCPIYENVKADSPLHIHIETETIEGCVHCEKMTMLDLDVRGHRKLGHITMNAIMDISDAIQGIFDYI